MKEIIEWHKPKDALPEVGLVVLVIPKDGLDNDIWETGIWNGKKWMSDVLDRPFHKTTPILYWANPRGPNAELRGAKPTGEASRSNDVLGATNNGETK